MCFSIKFCSRTDNSLSLIIMWSFVLGCFLAFFTSVIIMYLGLKKVMFYPDDIFAQRVCINTGLYLKQVHVLHCMLAYIAAENDDQFTLKTSCTLKLLAYSIFKALKYFLFMNVNLAHFLASTWSSNIMFFSLYKAITFHVWQFL